MFGFITRQAHSVGAQPRPEVGVDMSDVRSSGGARQAVGLALVAMGQRLAGELPSGRTAQPDGDCA